MKMIRAALQIVVIILFTLIGNLISHSFQLPIPGSVIGLVLLFASLQLKIVRMEWIEAGANFLLAELLLFFVPSAVGIIQYKQLMMMNGTRIVLVIIVGTAIVMACTGLLAELINRYKEEKESKVRKHDGERSVGL
jgi:holin-like protein